MEEKKLSIGRIVLRDIRLYAYHGCLAEEAEIGSAYRVEVSVEGDLGKAARSDDLGDTLDYSRLNEIVRAEMAIRSRLLEHVAKRILDRIGRELQGVQRADLQIAKLNPTLSGAVGSAAVILHQSYG